MTTRRSLTKAQRVVLTAAFVPMVATGVAAWSGHIQQHQECLRLRYGDGSGRGR